MLDQVTQLVAARDADPEIDLGFGRPEFVTVWDTGLVGTHGGDAQFVLGQISQHMDLFLTEYLRANDDACALR